MLFFLLYKEGLLGSGNYVLSCIQSNTTTVTQKQTQKYANQARICPYATSATMETEILISENFQMSQNKVFNYIKMKKL